MGYGCLLAPVWPCPKTLLRLNLHKGTKRDIGFSASPIFLRTYLEQKAPKFWAANWVFFGELQSCCKCLRRNDLQKTRSPTWYLCASLTNGRARHGRADVAD